MEYMAAHLSKIHGLDWHPDNEFILATSSQDNSVRVRLTGVRVKGQRKTESVKRRKQERQILLFVPPEFLSLSKQQCQKELPCNREKPGEGLGYGGASFRVV